MDTAAVTATDIVEETGDITMVDMEVTVMVTVGIMVAGTMAMAIVVVTGEIMMAVATAVGMMLWLVLSHLLKQERSTSKLLALYNVNKKSCSSNIQTFPHRV
ncbi:hypothetical protein BJV82DRAFT_596181 [Fennellomyces sp. T-0311]|nr:hypothetical protein BJV82DRAFT_596181 [Fennellomyces sp. T-0311]